MILLALLLYVIVEIGAFVVVAEHVGVLFAVVLVLVISASGPFLVRRAGLGVLEHARARLARGASPDRELLDGVVLLFGGALVCVPGFLTDLVGLALLIGPLRHLLIRLAGRHLAKRLNGRFVGRVGPRPPSGGPVLDVEESPRRQGPGDAQAS